MPITDYDALDELCIARGIALGYHDIWGNYHQPTVEAKLSLLGAIDIPVHDNADINRALEQEYLRGWDRIVAPVLVVAENQTPIRITLTLEPTQIDNTVSWELSQETGGIRRGDWTLTNTNVVAERVVNETLLKQFEMTLPQNPGIGYHSLKISTANKVEVQTSLIVTPQGCYQPQELDRGQKLWGITLQLYAMRSCRNWGIGDFSDLHSAVDILAPLGVNIIGLNPLHALFPHHPEQASPYSPTSRDFLNPLYLNIEAIDEFEHCEEAQQLVADEEFQVRLKALRDVELVDYTGVWKAKLEALKILYRYFRHNNIGSNSVRAEAFRNFQAEGGTDLHQFAVFEALQEQLYQQDASLCCWNHWPQRYRDPGSEAMAVWVDSNSEEIEFHQYLQWNSEQQLAKVQQHCVDSGMTIGLYRDLAVGVARASAQTWATQLLYALDSSIGAPPDDFNLQGQDWKLPPLKPQAFIDQAYLPFVKTLRANMRHASALRIDHVMGLMRLFWVPPNCPAKAGSYVTYPFTDLLGILALESQRNQCMIIGEDLGTVPDEVREVLQTNKVLSYRILYFEKSWHDGIFKSPSHYPYYAVAAIGSHDLPTLSGFWQESDLDLNDKLELFSSSEHRHRQRSTRTQDRIEIVAALEREKLISSENTNNARTVDNLCTELILAVHRYLARSEAMLMMVQLEDLFGQKNQVNVPGTVDQHPNWRRKLPLNIEEWLSLGNLAFYAQAITRERGS